MKIVCALACLLAVASGFVYEKDISTVPMTVDQHFFDFILRHNWQPLNVKEYYEFIEFPVRDETKYGNVGLYKTYIYPFFELYEHGLMLPRGRVGTTFDEKFMEQTGYLFNLFYYSADMPTLFHNILWARYNVNELMFVHAVHLFIFHHENYQHIVLPPLYEILPHHFFTYETIQKGIDYKMAGLWKLNSTFTQYTDYTSRFYMDKFYEQRMAYFTEDIGLNSFYYYFNMRYPTWMSKFNTKDVFGFDKTPVGELFFYFHQQLLARYYLERMSNDMGGIYTFSWVKGIKNGYWPMLRYKNGVEFSYRSDFLSVDAMKSDDLDAVQYYETQIRTMIDSGYVYLDDKKYYINDPLFTDVLGKYILGHDTPYYKYIFYFYHFLAGGHKTVKMDSYFYAPSVLEHFETMLRDPVFYQLYYRIVNYYYQYKTMLPSYKVDDLLVPVKITDVVVGDLNTYFEYDTIDATNVVDLDIVDTTYDYKFLIRQPRLNYKPFDVKLMLDVETAGDYTVRFFLGPKILNRYQLDEYRQFFFELDHFITKLTVGKNTIVRNSREFLYFFRDLIKFGNTGDFKYLEQYGFPKGLLLPKGKIGGMPFTFYVIVHKNDNMQYLGFPFDRKIDILNFFVPNMYYKDVLIYQYADYDLYSPTPLNNIYYKDVIPMNSVRVPLNVDYYKDNTLDWHFWHFNDVYKVWYVKYMNYGTKHYDFDYDKKDYGKFYGKQFTKDTVYGDDYYKKPYGLEKTFNKEFYPTFDKKFEFSGKKYDTFDKKYDTYDKKFQTFDKKYDTYDKKFETFDKKFDTFDKKYDTYDKKFQTFDKKYDTYDKKFDTFDKKYDTFDKKYNTKKFTTFDKKFDTFDRTYDDTYTPMYKKDKTYYERLPVFKHTFGDVY